MYLKIVTPSDDVATAVVETIIRCGAEAMKLRHDVVDRTRVTSIFLKGTPLKLDLCRRSIAKENYFDAGAFSFKTARTYRQLGESE